MKVLIIDDDPRDLMALRMLVASSSDPKEIELAASGAEAVLMVSLFQPDLIVLDYLMPGMSGAESAAYMRRLRPESFIVAVSAHIDGDADWADGSVRKDDLSELPALIDHLSRDSALSMN